MSMPPAEPDDSDRLVWPDLTGSDLDHVALIYDADIDYLYVFLYGRPLPAVYDPRGDGYAYVGIRLTEDSRDSCDVVSVMVENFQYALRSHPGWGLLAELAAQDEHAVPGRDAQATRRAAIASFLADVKSMGPA